MDLAGQSFDARPTSRLLKMRPSTRGAVHRLLTMMGFPMCIEGEGFGTIGPT